MTGAAVRQRYQAHLGAMTRWQATAGPLASAVAHFRAVTQRYWAGLFHCYDVPGLPRTNNDLEHLFGTVRYRERRASGRKVAAPSLVLRGSVRVLAVLGTPVAGVPASELAPRDLAAWRTLRHRLEVRHVARRAQRRFRRAPAAYLTQLEQQLLQSTLPP